MTRKHNEDKVIVFERGGLLWVLNFHPTQSFVDYRVAVQHPGKYRVALDSDAREFDGHGRVDPHSEYFTSPMAWDGREHSLTVYLPSRTGLVLFRS